MNEKFTPGPIWADREEDSLRQCPIEQIEQEADKFLLIVCFSIAFGLGLLTGAIICAGTIICA